MRKHFGWLCGAAMLLFTAAVYSRLPAELPTHWNAAGEVDGWSSRFVGSILLPVIALTTWALINWLPSIDPRRANYDKFRGAYELMANALVAFMTLVHVLVLGVGLGWTLPVGRIIFAATGMLFLVIGNILPLARPNWFFGIRTPWTLTSDRVWDRTHRLGGYLFMICGLLFLVAAAVGRTRYFQVLGPAVIVMALVLVGYSLVSWKREHSP